MEVKPGYKQTEVGVIPEEWEVKPLKRISPQQSVGLVINPSTYFDPAGVVPLLVGSNVSENAIDSTTSNRITKASNEMLSASRLATGDLVTVRVGEPGVTAVVPTELDGCNCASMMIVRKHPSFDSQWLCSMMNSHHGRQQVEHVQYGTAQKQFNISDAVNFRYPVPSLPEQRAIAEALGDVDALLGALDRLIAKKRDLKQAAMQQLLTGQTRLPGFEGEWEETTLGALATFLSGGTPSRSNEDYWTGDIPWISASTLRCFEIWRSDSNVTNEAVAAGSKMAPVGSSLLLVRGSALHNEILCGLVTQPVCFNQDVKALVPRSQVVPKFLTLFIRGTAEELLKLVSSAGNTAGVLDTKLLKAFAINLPPLPEQTAIADVLSDMDVELVELTRRRDKTRMIKQGMMQELLTGRTRLL